MNGPGPTTRSDGRTGRLGEIACLFLKLGTTAFGGPAAHIAMMEDEVVRRRAWLTREEFLDLLGATNLIPGPNSTEMAIHVGHRRAGWAGLAVAGACFILPASLLTLAVAWAYVHYGTLPSAGGFLYGVKAAILAVVVQALWRLGRSAVKTRALGVACVAAVAANALGAHELVVLFVVGLLFAVARAAKARPTALAPSAAMAAAPLLPLAMASAPATVPFGLLPLFLFFLKTGAVLFGSRYVLLAFLRADLVEWGWMSDTQVLDAIAAGQVTPGPVFTTATFVGYLLGGFPGAALATLGIFLPSFVFVALSGPLVPRLRRSPVAAAFLDGVIVASLALMGVVTWQLARSAVVDLQSGFLALASLLLLFRVQVHSIGVVVGGGALGLLIAWTR